MRFVRSGRVALALLLCGMLPPATAPAAVRASSRVPVTVALVEHLPAADGPYAILRRPDVAPNDVILLPRSAANPRLLSDAVQALLLARRQGGDVPSAHGRMRVRLGQDAEGRERAVLPWAPRVIQDLRRAAPVDVAGVGTVPAVQIWLPRQQAE